MEVLLIASWAIVVGIGIAELLIWINGGIR